MLKHHFGVDNEVVDAPSHVITVLLSMKNSIVSFEGFKDEYSQCPNFGIIIRSP